MMLALRGKIISTLLRILMPAAQAVQEMAENFLN
jgi:hypothetical protein